MEIEKDKLLLIVDDDQSLIEFYREAFAVEISAGFPYFKYRIALETDPVLALGKIVSGEYTPTVIILDIMMPKMTGIEFARAVKKIDPSIVLIYHTGYADVHSPHQAAMEGLVSGYLLKPTSFKCIRLLKSMLSFIQSEKPTEREVDLISKTLVELNKIKSEVPTTMRDNPDNNKCLEKGE